MPRICEHLMAKWTVRENGNKILICPECAETVEEYIKFGNPSNE